MNRFGIRYLFVILALALPPCLLQAQVQVRVEPVLRAPIAEELPLSGSVLSPRYSDLSTQESGLVISLNVETGDRVEQGDILLQLDGELTRLELQRLLARQEETRLAYEDARRLADKTLVNLDAYAHGVALADVFDKNLEY